VCYERQEWRGNFSITLSTREGDNRKWEGNTEVEGMQGFRSIYNGDRYTQASLLGNGTEMRLAGIATRKEYEGNNIMEQSPC
jgi:hypothetical protein